MPHSIKFYLQIKPQKSRKFLYIGWKHKSDSSKRDHQQVKEPFGGVKKVELDKNSDYSYEQILQLSLTAMRNSMNASTFDNSIIELASNEEDIIHQFTNANGKKCNFWEFSPKIKTKNSQLRLYLHTTPLEVTIKSKIGNEVPKKRSVDQSSSVQSTSSGS